MNWINEITSDKEIQSEFRSFYNKYGISGIKNAFKLYTEMHQEYICKTKTSISKIPVQDIYYLEILEHNISVHTLHGIYHKYGTLSKELKFLTPYGFIQCSKSLIVSLNKIRTITHDSIILVNGNKIHMSRNYAPKILLEFSRHHPIH